MTETLLKYLHLNTQTKIRISNIVVYGKIRMSMVYHMSNACIKIMLYIYGDETKTYLSVLFIAYFNVTKL